MLDGMGWIRSFVLNVIESVREEISAMGDAGKMDIGNAAKTWWGAKEWPRRLSRTNLKLGAKRPAVFSLQRLLQVEEDGVFGPKTFERVKQRQANAGIEQDGIVGPQTWRVLFDGSREKGIDIPLWMRVFEWVSWVETGERQDAFGYAENDIGDGAGANYGCIQYNGQGSMKRLLEKNGKHDFLHLYQDGDRHKVFHEIRRWMGSPEGIRAQVQDFMDVIFNPTQHDLDELGFRREKIHLEFLDRVVCLLADIRVQNGSLFSPYRCPYKDLVFSIADELELVGLSEDTAQTVLDVGLDTFEKYHGLGRGNAESNRRAMQEMVTILVSALGAIAWKEAIPVMIAVWRGACSRKKYARRVIDRKLAIAKLRGVVHGSHVDLSDDFGIK